MISKEKLKTMVMESVGTASMCWLPIPTGVFDSTAAIKVADELTNRILAALKDQHQPTEEPVKDCGFTLKTCPYERSSGITMRKTEEPPKSIKDTPEYKKEFEKWRDKVKNLADSSEQSQKISNEDYERKIGSQSALSGINTEPITCPQCLRTLYIHSIKEEPLAVLAERKGLRIQVFKVTSGWTLCIVKKTTTIEKIRYSTYPEAESKARAYLNTLEDK